MILGSNEKVVKAGDLRYEVGVKERFWSKPIN